MRPQQALPKHPRPGWPRAPPLPWPSGPCRTEATSSLSSTCTPQGVHSGSDARSSNAIILMSISSAQAQHSPPQQPKGLLLLCAHVTAKFLCTYIYMCVTAIFVLEVMTDQLVGTACQLKDYHGSVAKIIQTFANRCRSSTCHGCALWLCHTVRACFACMPCWIPNSSSCTTRYSCFELTAATGAKQRCVG